MSDSPRRDRLIVAWHEVPGKRPPKEPSRRVRYDRRQLLFHVVDRSLNRGQKPFRPSASGRRINLALMSAPTRLSQVGVLQFSFFVGKKQSTLAKLRVLAI